MFDSSVGQVVEYIISNSFHRQFVEGCLNNAGEEEYQILSGFFTVGAKGTGMKRDGWQIISARALGIAAQAALGASVSAARR